MAKWNVPAGYKAKASSVSGYQLQVWKRLGELFHVVGCPSKPDAEAKIPSLLQEYPVADGFRHTIVKTSHRMQIVEDW